MYDAADSAAAVIDGAAKVTLRSCRASSDVYISGTAREPQLYHRLSSDGERT